MTAGRQKNEASQQMWGYFSYDPLKIPSKDIVYLILWNQISMIWILRILVFHYSLELQCYKSKNKHTIGKLEWGNGNDFPSV